MLACIPIMHTNSRLSPGIESATSAQSVTCPVIVDLLIVRGNIEQVLPSWVPQYMEHERESAKEVTDAGECV